jgi:hypothetical protein
MMSAFVLITPFIKKTANSTNIKTNHLHTNGEV